MALRVRRLFTLKAVSSVGKNSIAGRPCGGKAQADEGVTSDCISGASYILFTSCGSKLLLQDLYHMLLLHIITYCTTYCLRCA